MQLKPMMQKKILSFLIFFCASVLMVPRAFSKTYELGDLTSSRVIHIAKVDKDYPPMEYVDENGKLAGIHIDKIDKAAKLSNIKVIADTYPFLRCVEMMQNGEADAMPFLQKNPEREKFLHYFDGNLISKGGFSFIVRKDSDLIFTGDLAGFFSDVKNVGVVQGYARPETLKPYEPLFEASKDDETLIKKLIAKRYAAAIETNSTAQEILDRFDANKETKLISPPITAFDIYIAFSKKLTRSDAEQKNAKDLALEFAQAFNKCCR